jgi:hypothetical protein
MLKRHEEYRSTPVAGMLAFGCQRGLRKMTRS